MAIGCPFRIRVPDAWSEGPAAELALAHVDYPGGVRRSRNSSVPLLSCWWLGVLEASTTCVAVCTTVALPFSEV